MNYVLTTLIAVGALDIVCIAVWAVNEDRVMSGRKPLLATRWSLLEIFLAVQAAVALSIAPVLAVAAFFATGPESGPVRSMDWLHGNPTARYALLATSTISLQLSFLGVTTYLVRSHYKLSWRSVGFPGRLQLWEPAAGVAVGLLLLAIVPAIQMLTERTIESLYGPMMLARLRQLDPTTATGQMISKLALNPFAIMSLLTVTVVLAPICEEALFRGLIGTALRVRFGFLVGVVGSGVIFALAHAPLLALPSYVVLGCALGYAYLRGGSLWVTIFAHATNNLVATSVAVFLGGRSS